MSEPQLNENLIPNYFTKPPQVATSNKLKSLEYKLSLLEQLNGGRPFSEADLEKKLNSGAHIEFAVPDGYLISKFKTGKRIFDRVALVYDIWHGSYITLVYTGGKWLFKYYKRHKK